MKKAASEVLSILVVVALPGLLAYGLVSAIAYWTAPAPIQVMSASYGANCGAPRGNATASLQETCSGREYCVYVIDHQKLGDPAQGCAKAFEVEYKCPPGATGYRSVVADAGTGSQVELTCQARSPSAGLQVQSATYGRNCGAMPGNSTALVARACSGKSSCDYRVDVNVLRDPAPGCGKDFAVQFMCPGDAEPRSTVVPGEAGFGSLAKLSCASQ